ncbi:MAG TPA: metallophosphoesterase [Polyangiales bacterium]
MLTAKMTARIAIVGDIHGHWDDWDARYFSREPYDLMLVTGDLGSGSSDHGVRIARSLGRVARRGLIMPGNNDVVHAAQIAAEIGHQRGLASLLRHGGGAAEHAAGEVHVCGYSVHPFEFAGRALSVLAARPYSRGGPELSYATELRERFGVSSMHDSTVRLCALIDRVQTRDLIVLAHNGPTGLGASATDLWGRDFTAEQGDWGDPDLTAALAYARARDKRILAVVAGHMHTRTRNGEQRSWQDTRDGTLYINAARVPRIWEEHSGKYRHHIELHVDERVRVRELIVREPD